jgi:hypothetical protein
MLKSPQRTVIALSCGALRMHLVVQQAIYRPHRPILSVPEPAKDD